MVQNENKNKIHIKNKIDGKISIDMEKIKGDKVEDIFKISSDYKTLEKELFPQKEPLKISLAAGILMNSQKLIFRMKIWTGFAEYPVIVDMPRSAMKSPKSWVNKHLINYPKMTPQVLEYISAALSKVLPHLESQAKVIKEQKSISEVRAELIKKIREKELPNDTLDIGQYKVTSIKDGEGTNDFVCIKGAAAFKAILKEIESPYSHLELLKAFDNHKDGSLLKKDAERYDYKFKSSDSVRWYCIKIEKEEK